MLFKAELEFFVLIFILLPQTWTNIKNAYRLLILWWYIKCSLKLPLRDLSIILLQSLRQVIQWKEKIALRNASLTLKNL